MRLTIDTERAVLIRERDGRSAELPLYSKEAFETISDVWLKVGWNEKYPYSFSWFGRPIIQIPEDIVRMQEAIYAVRPTVIVETGVAHGGSLIFYASLFKGMGIDGRVIGVDIEIRPHNRRAIEAHELSSFITLVEGSSTDPRIVEQVRALVPADARVMVVLDSNHSRAHVLAELRAYERLVSPGSYIVATDGSMKDLADVPRGKAEWTTDNPEQAAREFLAEHRDFELAPPAWPFNESALSERITHWPGAWIRRRSERA